MLDPPRRPHREWGFQKPVCIKVQLKNNRAKVEQGVKALKSRLERLEVKKAFRSERPAIDLQPPSPIYNHIVLRVDGLSKVFLESSSCRM